jgi:2-octaprenyl-6-methoxyphenol hydroxylase
MNVDFDVCIVGGGLVGASLAVALAPLHLRVALIESAAPPQTAASWDERCIAINDGSHRIFDAMGVWPALLGQAEPITSTHISERGRFGVARFTAAEAGLPALGYNIPLRHIGQVLWQQMQTTTTTLFCPAKVVSVHNEPHQAQLTLDTGAVLNTKLVIAADGAQSALRQFLAIENDAHDYQQSAIISALRTQRLHAGVAYERFTPGGPFAVLPKPDNACSLVWTVPRDQVPTMLAWSDTEFLAQAQEMFGERLGRFTELGRRNAHPLTRVMSDQLSAPRVLFAGNAAQALHPVAAQGFNLGLRDVAAVAEVLAGVSDPGADEVLADYRQRREQDRARVAGFTDRLVRTFSNNVPGLRSLRHLGLLALDLAPPLKQAVLRQNLGQGVGAPRLTREYKA